jgi:hypothetical protein
MQALAISNKLSLNRLECFTKVIQFKDAGYSYDFDYKNNPTFYQQVRIHLDLQDTKPITSEKIYRQSDGVYKRGNTFIDKEVNLYTDQLDDETNLSLAVALKHQEFSIEGIPYFAHGEYETEPNDFSNLQRGHATLYEQGFNKTNIKC